MLKLNSKYVSRASICIIVLSVFCLFTNIKAQNLVPNHNFDSIIECPSTRGQLQFAVPWYSPNFETTDLMHECSDSRRTSIPDNFWGSQYPASGRGMAGIRTYLDPEAANKDDYKEFVAVELTDSLIADETYFLSFKVSPGENNVYVTDDVGMFLTDIYPRDMNLLTATPVLENATNWLLSNYASWFEIKGNYVAKGGEKHLVIGNFKDNENTTLAFPLNPREGAESAYLFIDEVVVEPCSSRLPERLITNETASICNGTTISLNTDLSESNFPLWNNGSEQASIEVNEPGMYFVEATINGCTMRDSILIEEEAPLLMPNPDTIICQGESVLLLADTAANNLWSNGLNADTLLVSSPGDYVLTSSKNSCVVSDTISVSFQQLPEANITDTLVCEGSQLTLGLDYPNAAYSWNVGDTSQSIEVFESGIYTAQVRTECFNFNKRYFVTFIPCGCGFFAPNAISPNNDGINEQFEILVDNAVEPLQLNIVNRWGELVFSGEKTAIWETAESGSLPESGTYYWEFSYRCFEEGKEQTRQQNGYVQVLK